MSSRIKLHHLRDFVAIAQHKSLRGAARALTLAQPALTRSLRELEHELGASLVERHARGVVLTDIGKRFLMRAQSAVEEVRRATEEVAQLGGSGSGQVAVALSTAAMIGMLPAAVRAFRAAYPQARLRVVEGVYSTVEARLLDGQLDFFIGPRPERVPKSLRVELCFANERVVVARKRHPLGQATSLADLVDCEWIRVESTLGLLSILGATDALVLLPRQWTDTPMFRGVLLEIPVREKLLAPDIVLVSRASVPLTPLAEKMTVFLQRASGTPLGLPAAM